VKAWAHPDITGVSPRTTRWRSALATLTDADKADPQLAAILGAYVAPAAGRGGRGQ